MTLRHMQIFQAVYQKKSITRAAEALCMTQPAVTRAIRELETYYGVRLFDRINRRLYVTEVGTRLYTYSLHILNSFDQLEKLCNLTSTELCLALAQLIREHKIEQYSERRAVYYRLSV